MSPVGFRHGATIVRLCARLMQHAQEHGVGAVVTEVRSKLTSKPDTVRAPDVAFVRQDRIPTPEPRGVWNGPPDLAVEVLSPDDRPEEVREKLTEYLTHGVPVVVLVDPDTRKINVLRAATSELALAPGDVLDLGDAVSGFSCSVPRAVRVASTRPAIRKAEGPSRRRPPSASPVSRMGAVTLPHLPRSARAARAV